MSHCRKRQDREKKNAPIRILHPVPATLDDIDLAAARPGAVRVVDGEHPDCGPELLSEYMLAGALSERERRGRMGREEEGENIKYKIQKTKREKKR
jgi:hypothetical protein